MRPGILLLVLLLLLGPAGPLLAESAGSAGGGPESPSAEIRLTLQAALQLALKNNLTIAIGRADPEIREQEWIREKSVFDPTVSLSLSKNRSVTQTGSALASPLENESEDVTVEAGVASRFPTGTETDLRLTNGRNRTNSSFAGLNPSYDSDLILSLTQPLLKDFGIGVNTARIRIAANDREISAFQFQEDVMEVLSRTESAYWELVYARQELEVQRESLRLARDFLEMTRRKVEVGLLAPVESLQAEAEKAAREEGVITAADALGDAEDGLRRALNLADDPRYWEVRLIPSEEPLLESEAGAVEEHLRQALEKRPDLNRAKLDLQSKEIRLRYTQNQLLPRLDLVGSLGLTGLAGRPQPQPDLGNPGATIENPFSGGRSDSLEELRSGDHYNYTVGLQVEYPLGNRAARSERTIAGLEKQKALYGLKDLENLVIREVREAFRQIGTNRKRIAAAEAARKLAEERLRAETRRYEVGLATSHDVLDYQERLSTARTRELRARIDYRESLVNLERVKGTLLESKGIVL